VIIKYQDGQEDKTTFSYNALPPVKLPGREHPLFFVVVKGSILYEDDARKQLWQPYLQIVEHIGTQIFLMENVPQLLGSEEHDEIITAAHSLDFKLSWAKLCAVDYGVPQTRWQAFILGGRFALIPPSDGETSAGATSQICLAAHRHMPQGSRPFHFFGPFCPQCP
jgi:site-specific DNA-cytosine methylase